MAYKNDTFVHSFSEWRELCFCSTDYVLAAHHHHPSSGGGPAEQSAHTRSHPEIAVAQLAIRKIRL